MFSVAIVGPDGAGKTTISQRVRECLPMPVRTIYMGINTEASNVRLPFSSFVDGLKRARQQRSAKSQSSGMRSRRWLWPALRLVYRIAEESYRQIVSLIAQRRGFVVVYDRYFSFDFAYEPEETRHDWTERVHRWWLKHVYAEPDLVVFLDAPAHVLFARKGEGTIESLDARRQAFLRKGAEFPNFISVDATRELQRVTADVVGTICEFAKTRSVRATAAVASR